MPCTTYVFILRRFTTKAFQHSTIQLFYTVCRDTLNLASKFILRVEWWLNFMWAHMFCAFRFVGCNFDVMSLLALDNDFGTLAKVHSFKRMTL